MALPRFRMRMRIPTTVLLLLLVQLTVRDGIRVAEAKPSYRDRTPFQNGYAVSWSADHVRWLDGGEQIQLTLDQASGSGFQSINTFLFGYFSIQLKLVPGNSAGTVTTFYLTSEGSSHDEVDFEFLGNLAGQPYILQTNVFAGGRGGREQRIHLWFDPTQDFHSYTISWNPQQIIFFVDSYPIRVFKNNEGLGVPYPNKRPMRVVSSLWDGSDWATDGGKVKIDWRAAPFVASYRSFGLADTCLSSSPDCGSVAAGSWWGQGAYVENPLGGKNGKKFARVRKQFLIYDYCDDRTRYPAVPPECANSP